MGRGRMGVEENDGEGQNLGTHKTNEVISEWGFGSDEGSQCISVV